MALKSAQPEELYMLHLSLNKGWSLQMHSAGPPFGHSCWKYAHSSFVVQLLLLESLCYHMGGGEGGGGVCAIRMYL